MQPSFWEIPVKEHSPIFYGTIEDHKNNNRKDNGDLSEDELIVTCMVSGEYEWYDKNYSNILHNNYSKNVLSVCTSPSTVLVDVPSYDDEHFTKRFTKTSGGWVVKSTRILAMVVGVHGVFIMNTDRSLRKRLS